MWCAEWRDRIVRCANTCAFCRLVHDIKSNRLATHCSAIITMLHENYVSILLKHATRVQELWLDCRQVSLYLLQPTRNCNNEFIL